MNGWFSRWSTAMGEVADRVVTTATNSLAHATTGTGRSTTNTAATTSSPTAHQQQQQEHSKHLKSHNRHAHHHQQHHHHPPSHFHQQQQQQQQQCHCQRDDNHLQIKPFRFSVSWGRQQFHIDESMMHPSSATLATLKHYLSQLTHLPISQLKLIIAGVPMRDDHALLTTYGVTDGKRIMLNAAPPPQLPPSSLSVPPPSSAPSSDPPSFPPSHSDSFDDNRNFHQQSHRPLTGQSRKHQRHSVPKTAEQNLREAPKIRMDHGQQPTRPPDQHQQPQHHQRRAQPPNDAFFYQSSASQQQHQQQQPQQQNQQDRSSHFRGPSAAPPSQSSPSFPAKPMNTDPAQLVEKITTSVQKLDTLEPRIKDYVAAIQVFCTAEKRSEPQPEQQQQQHQQPESQAQPPNQVDRPKRLKQLKDEYLCLNEALMQILLDIDSVQIPMSRAAMEQLTADESDQSPDCSEESSTFASGISSKPNESDVVYDEARAARKKAVRSIQGYMETLDGMKSQLAKAPQ